MSPVVGVLIFNERVVSSGKVVQDVLPEDISAFAFHRPLGMDLKVTYRLQSLKEGNKCVRSFNLIGSEF